ncbi:T-cell antigen CD7 isoform X2 [Melopsittacus undulatus]|uniref:T-cell antigen CD7 isoform X2 n=1 Tax=Melopsittacus undulatus TaxID=13146 RepID=UPI001469E703|nr:T-cell antigen CD7 isoform X2 [Melopsittacus undulatus]
MPWICLPTALLFLLHLPCFPGQNGGENEESTDIISVREGESINITCSIEGSENEVGTYLKTSIQPVNVVYVSRHNTSYILPALANRTKYSKEGSNLRITLHNVQESDSNIYQCSTYVKTESNHRKLFGKTTIVVVKGKRSGTVEQAPLYVNPQQGQSVSITCALKTSHENEGIYLLKTHMQPEPVLYVSEGEQTDCKKNSWLVYVLITMVMLLFSVLMCCTLNRVDLKKYFQNNSPNTVYEDMSYSVRQHTLQTTNACCIDN